MLSPKQVKPFILHEKKNLREAAVSYFEGAESQDEDLVPMILDACELYGDKECRQLLVWGNNFTITLSTSSRILKKLETVQDWDVRRNLEEILAECPLEFLIENNKEIFASLQERDCQKQMSLRLKLDNLPAEELWERLIRYTRCQDAALDGIDDADLKTLEEVGYSYDTACKIIIKQFASLPTPDIHTLIDHLLIERDRDSYLRFHIMNLIGLRRNKEAVPQLLDLFPDPKFVLSDELNIALTRIQDPSIVSGFQERYESYNSTNRSDCLFLLGFLKFPESEQAILDILHWEMDTKVRTNGCKSLYSLFSESGLPIVAQHIVDKLKFEYDHYETLQMLEELETSAEIIGTEIPNIPGIEKVKQKLEAKRQKELEQEQMKFEQVQKNLAPTRKKDSQQDSGTIVPVRTEPKIGRNDPCPCGSGKKYKKCCGKNA